MSQRLRYSYFLALLAFATVSSISADAFACERLGYQADTVRFAGNRAVVVVGGDMGERGRVFTFSNDVLVEVPLNLNRPLMSAAVSPDASKVLLVELVREVHPSRSMCPMSLVRVVLVTLSDRSRRVLLTETVDSIGQVGFSADGAAAYVELFAGRQQIRVLGLDGTLLANHRPSRNAARRTEVATDLRGRGIDPAILDDAHASTGASVVSFYPVILTGRRFYSASAGDTASHRVIAVSREPDQAPADQRITIEVVASNSLSLVTAWGGPGRSTIRMNPR